jgi:hypothetical protein
MSPRGYGRIRHQGENRNRGRDDADDVYPLHQQLERLDNGLHQRIYAEYTEDIAAAFEFLHGGPMGRGYGCIRRREIRQGHHPIEMQTGWEGIHGHESGVIQC